MHRRSRLAKGILLVTLGAAVAVTVLIYALYARDMRQINQRVSAQSQSAETRHGTIEFASWGGGPAVLVVHGAGGGYDQGRLIPQAFAGGEYRWISVSRFGYLRSSRPNDASTAAQAEAFADLLDFLKIDRVAIIAMSGGVPPSLQFAQMFPKRTSALVLLSSAPFTPLSAGEQDLPIPAWLYQILFSSDFAFWAIVKLSPSSLDPIFDISPQARARMTQADMPFVQGLIDAFLPVTKRTAGLRNEGAAIDPNASYDLAKISAPTLVIHAKDDGINPFLFGEYTARNIPGTDFMALETGGHLLLGHLEEIRTRVSAFLKANTAGGQ
jgi:2-hydroxy-6-oxonona-2,4-dienedioate hydrolase